MSNLVRAALTALLVLPSLHQVEKYLGRPGLAVFPFAVLALVLAAERVAAQVEARLSERHARALAAVMMAGIFIAFAVLFPMANTNVPGRGSDTDEAYDLAVRAMARGEYPYTELTYLGNRIHHLPGSLFLAAPFVALGTSAYQSLFWLGAYLWLLAAEFGLRRALPLFGLILCASPAVMQQTVTGSDGVTSGISVFVAVWCLLRSWGEPGVNAARRWGAVLLFALAVSNRPNFGLAGIPVMAFLLHRHGLGTMMQVGLAIGGLVLAINLPFYLHNPAGFAPLEGMDRVTRFSRVLPHSGIVLPAVALLITGALAWPKSAGTIAGAATSLAAGQFFLVAAGMALMSVLAGRLDTGYAGYGSYFLFAGAFALWRQLLKPADARAAAE
ncbi:MAG: hypothetical protein FD161_3808 [Limisphaerales bacterium]|nr:MAG: hypothetical protein FD161_3808 [Limisphaerales bacterium]KAG0507427.1 MAG: hypothetical protein E1N63_3405 [Limisphaerales bacterium]TXT51438.1 MAG: hypothetical protein FD140_1719 [Limisphaerales bacterium]